MNNVEMIFKVLASCYHGFAIRGNSVPWSTINNVWNYTPPVTMDLQSVVTALSRNLSFLLAFQADDNLNDEELRTQQNNIYEIIQNLNFDKFLNSSCYQNLINSVGEDEYPLFVFKILNKDGIVQIGNFLFKLDFINRVRINSGY